MNVDAFLSSRSPQWQELEALLDRGGRRPERLGAARLRRLGALYRSTAADLAYARRRYPGDPVVTRLERLVATARLRVYDAPTRRLRPHELLGRAYWRRVVERPRLLAAAALLLFAPWGLAALWALSDPAAAGGLVPSAYAAVTEPRPEGADLGLSAEEEAAFAATIFTNNIQVSIVALAGGIAAGLGTALVLVVNGVLLGTVTGMAFGSGNGRVFYELVVAHGVLELSCIVVAGAAGLRLGWALVEPGHRTRGESLRHVAGPTMTLVLGTAPWLVLAGLVEGFLTPAGAGLEAVTVVGFGLGALYWTLAVVLGRIRTAPAASPADTR